MISPTITRLACITRVKNVNEARELRIETFDDFLSLPTSQRIRRDVYGMSGNGPLVFKECPNWKLHKPH